MLRVIDDQFIDEYIFNHRNSLSKTNVGGTDWRFVDIVAPAFKQILEITNAKSVLEIGFNIGGSALMFLSISPQLIYHSIDITTSHKSIKFLSNRFNGFKFTGVSSHHIEPRVFGLSDEYDLVFIDGDHSESAVKNDIDRALLFNPKYILFDDVLHPSHKYIYDIITVGRKDVLELVRLYEFNQCWQGYSFALCKNKNHKS